MNMDGKTVIVAGLGVSGQSMMEVLGSRAGRVLGVDEKKPDADLHSFDQIDWDNTDMVMTSPVFNPRTPFILEAQKRNIPVMSEVELAWQLRVNSAPFTVWPCFALPSACSGSNRKRRCSHEKRKNIQIAAVFAADRMVPFIPAL